MLPTGNVTVPPCFSSSAFLALTLMSLLMSPEASCALALSAVVVAPPPPQPVSARAATTAATPPILVRFFIMIPFIFGASSDAGAVWCVRGTRGQPTCPRPVRRPDRNRRIAGLWGPTAERRAGKRRPLPFPAAAPG